MLSGGVFTLTASESGTLVRLPIEVPVAELPADDGRGQNGDDAGNDQPGDRADDNADDLPGVATGPNNDRGALAYTGVSGVLPLGIGALVLLAGGTAAVMAARRRGPADSAEH